LKYSLEPLTFRLKIVVFEPEKLLKDTGMAERPIKPGGTVSKEFDEKTRQNIGAGKTRVTPRTEEYEGRKVWRDPNKKDEAPTPQTPTVIPRVVTEEQLAAQVKRAAALSQDMEEIEMPIFIRNPGSLDPEEIEPPPSTDREVMLTTSTEVSPTLELEQMSAEPSLNGANGKEEKRVSKKFDTTPSKTTDTHKAKGWSSTLPAAGKITVSLWGMLVVGTHLGTNFGFDEFFPGSTVLTALLLIIGGIAYIAKSQSPIAAKKENYLMAGGALLITGVINLTASSFFSSQWLLTLFMFFD
jgi:hypothetical protein